MIVVGNIIDIHQRRIYPGRIHIKDGRIDSIEEVRERQRFFILPGLIDAHIHIESSMVTPGSFASGAVSRGTTAVVSDPHEIANVMGIEGINFMIEDSHKVPLKFFFGAPSCVPATTFESAGAVINAAETEKLLAMPEIKYLAEMMNYPGVIHGDPEVLKKLEAAVKYNKPVDGHAPGLSGELLRRYVSAGISTDHECTNLNEAREKLDLGMKILIREGSAAKNLDALKSLYKTDADKLMLCSDDLHPEMLVKQHINALAARLISEGTDIFDVIRSCTINPVRHYNLNAGLLNQGDPADLIVIDDPDKMNVIETWIDGIQVFKKGKVHFDYCKQDPVNNFNSSQVLSGDLLVRATGSGMRVIKAIDGSLVTEEVQTEIIPGSPVVPDIVKDILKLVVKDRYKDMPPSVGFINGFKLKRGAFAGSVAHDSHNIICVGTNDNDIVKAINKVVEMKGGLAVADGDRIDFLPLPVAGIISNEPVSKVAREYEYLSELVKGMGCVMSAPFMTLSFMALLVIPELKLSDKGLFDGREFRFTGLFFI